MSAVGMIIVSGGCTGYVIRYYVHKPENVESSRSCKELALLHWLTAKYTIAPRLFLQIDHV